MPTIEHRTLDKIPLHLVLNHNLEMGLKALFTEGMSTLLKHLNITVDAGIKLSVAYLANETVALEIALDFLEFVIIVDFNVFFIVRAWKVY